MQEIVKNSVNTGHNAEETELNVKYLGFTTANDPGWLGSKLRTAPRPKRSKPHYSVHVMKCPYIDDEFTRPPRAATN